MIIRILRKDLPSAFRWLFPSAPVMAGRVRTKSLGFGRMWADGWSAVGPLGPGGLWTDGQAAERLPLGMRVRAATALDPIRW